MNITVSYVDTCQACYILDHCNREGEMLVGVPVDGATKRHEVITGVFDEVNLADRIPAAVTNRALLDAIRRAVPGDPEGPFDDSLEVADEDDMGDPCQVWFSLTWG